MFTYIFGTVFNLINWCLETSLQYWGEIYKQPKADSMNIQGRFQGGNAFG